MVGFCLREEIMIPVLTAEEMRAADMAAIAGGTPQATLVKRAGAALASIIMGYYSPRRAVVVAGSGNNGADGHIAADILKNAGWNLSVITPDDDVTAAVMGADLVIDALLGTGLNKNVDGAYANAIAAINASGVPVVAVDIPSGINATTGRVMGCAVRAEFTVSFAAAKRGHYLLPGKEHTGRLHVVDIGIEVADAGAYLNAPDLWELPNPSLSSHKYSRGHALVMGGQISSMGAAKLTANAALKVGAGAVSVICDKETLPIYAASLAAVMTKPAGSMDEFYKIIHEPRVSALAIGPGAGVNEQTMAHAGAMLETKKPCVLDADALQKDLLPLMHEHTVITPHAGEFTRLFGEAADKMAAVAAALAKFPGVLVYKGSDTVIASRGRKLVINANAPATLATAGSGDVLAGIITGLLAQGMDAFDAACAGVWLHGEAAGRLGRFMTAEDLLGVLGELGE